MSPGARTIVPVGVYALVVGATVMIRPNFVLGILGLPPTEEPWIHLMGYFAVVIGAFYLAAARSEADAFISASVPIRVASTVVFLGVAAMWGYWPIALFAVPDAAGAAWTWSVLRRPAALPSHG
jgi:hypothetical protein